MKIVESKIIPLPRSDIDTDLIIPADFLTVTVKTGLGRHLFDRVRKMEENFPFNLAKYQGGEILVTGKNFGCGSSREHAAWALNDWGIKVIIASSFADIFLSNALKNAILPIKFSTDLVEKIFQMEKENDGLILSVDLENQMVTFSNGESFNFEIDPYRKECLMKGIDDMDYLLEHINDIDKFNQHHTLFFNIENL